MATLFDLSLFIRESTVQWIVNSAFFLVDGGGWLFYGLGMRVLLAISMLCLCANIQDGLHWTGYYANYFGRKVGRDMEWVTRPRAGKQWGESWLRSSVMVVSGPLSLLGVPLNAFFTTLAVLVPGERLRVEAQGPFESGDVVTVMSLNGCLFEGWFAPLSGGVVPPFEAVGGFSSRVAALAHWVGERGPDVFVGQEFFDLRAIEVFIQEMKKQGYRSFISDRSPHPVRMSSGLIVASKRELSDVSFIPFAMRDHAGTAKGMRLGTISFMVSGRLRVFNTHLNCGGESHQWARDVQLKKYILPRFQQGAAVLLGDLNMDTAIYGNEAGLAGYVNVIEGMATCTNEGKIKLRGVRESVEMETDDAIVLSSRDIKYQNTRVEKVEAGGALLSDHFGVSTQINLSSFKSNFTAP